MSYGVNLKDLRTSGTPFSDDEVKKFGSTLVFAPHPDDESLACGGLIAMLHAIRNQVHVIFISDGSLSHPGSGKFPSAVLSKLREKEALQALSLLGIDHDTVFFMRLKDGSVPGKEMDGFETAAEVIGDYIRNIVPETVIMPWRRDTHKDHRACWQLVNQALNSLPLNILVLEYPLWIWERGEARDLPGHDEMELRSLDISAFLSAKLKAINAHQSQVTRLIDDDPDGFWLSPEVIAHFTGSKEIYLVDKLPLQHTTIK